MNKKKVFARVKSIYYSVVYICVNYKIKKRKKVESKENRIETVVYIVVKKRVSGWKRSERAML